MQAKAAAAENAVLIFLFDCGTKNTKFVDGCSEDPAGILLKDSSTVHDVVQCLACQQIQHVRAA